VKFERTERFKADWQRLTDDERLLVRRAVDRFHAAAVANRQDPGVGWPNALRVKPVHDAPGIWEMTWSLSGPDGRATFEWIDLAGEPAIRWRRIGGHEVFREP